jgi:NAD(P)-dependent dehydrogenase (short-subunit alcohol dehydrogenase family)
VTAAKMSQKILLITGGNTGLGLETVKSLLFRSQASYKILLGGRSFDKAIAAVDALKKDLDSGSKSEVLPVQIDLEDDASIQALKEKIETDFGRVDVLVNNGGEWAAPLEDLSCLGALFAARLVRHQLSCLFFLFADSLDKHRRPIRPTALPGQARNARNVEQVLGRQCDRHLHPHAQLDPAAAEIL